MRVLHLYLVVYTLLVLGALVALWAGGALAQIPAIWLLLGVAIAAGLGVLLALATRVGASSDTGSSA